MDHPTGGDIKCEDLFMATYPSPDIRYHKRNSNKMDMMTHPYGTS